MRQSTTLFHQIVRMIPNSFIQNAIQAFGCDHRARTLRCKHHFFALLLGHLSGTTSLRHLMTTWHDHPELRTSLHMPVLARSTLSDANRNRPHQFFRAIAGQIIQATVLRADKLPRRLKRIAYCLDSTSLELCAELFGWALVSRQRAAVKLHTLLRTDAAIPELTFISEGCRHDLVTARKMPIPPGSIVSMDRAYVDASFFATLHDQGTVFITRMKRGMKYRVLYRRRIPRTARGIRADQEILLTGKGASIYGDRPLRRISYRDPDTGDAYVFLTNDPKLAARTIAGLYKDRWQVELFFKWIKQNLKIKSFWGRSRNAVLIQIWVALLAYALVSWINLRLRATWTRLRTWRFVQARLLHPVSDSFWISDA